MIYRSLLPLFGALSRLLPVSRRAQIVSWVVPSAHWYSTALLCSRLHGYMGMSLLGSNRALTEASMLDSWLMELTRHGPFPIPMTMRGLDTLDRAAADGTSLIFCWAHLPLYAMPLRAGVEAGWDAAMIADPSNIDSRGHFLVPGLKHRCVAIPAGPTTFARARTLMQGGKHLGCLLDPNADSPLSANILRFAGTVGAHVIFCWAERYANGSVHVTFADAPNPRCENETAVQQNIDYMHAEKRRVLKSLEAMRPSGNKRPVPAT